MSGDDLPPELTRVPRRGLDRLLEWAADRPRLLDLVRAVGGTGFLALIVAREPAGLPSVNLAVIVHTAAALALCRRWPMTCLTGLLALQAVMDLTGTPGPMSVPVCLGLFCVVTRAGTRQAAAGVAAAAVLAAFGAFHTGTGAQAVNIALGGWVLVLITTLTAILVRGRRAGLRRADEALRLAVRDLRLDRQRQDLTDRVAVAQDLHDSVGHALTAVIALGRGARKVLTRDPDEAARALDLLVATASSGLDRTRQVVDQLQDGPAGTTAEPDLSDLGRLAVTVRAAGLGLTVVQDGSAPPKQISSLAFRVAQEGLTNVLRHATGATCAHLHLTHTGDGSTVVLTDDGRPHPRAVTERGLAGLRQRVTRAGGTLTAGPAPDGGGWRLQVRIPVAGGGSGPDAGTGMPGSPAVAGRQEAHR